MSQFWKGWLLNNNWIIWLSQLWMVLVWPLITTCLQFIGWLVSESTQWLTCYMTCFIWCFPDSQLASTLFLYWLFLLFYSHPLIWFSGFWNTRILCSAVYLSDSLTCTLLLFVFLAFDILNFFIKPKQQSHGEFLQLFIRCNPHCEAVI